MSFVLVGTGAGGFDASIIAAFSRSLLSPFILRSSRRVGFFRVPCVLSMRSARSRDRVKSGEPKPLGFSFITKIVSPP